MTERVNHVFQGVEIVGPIFQRQGNRTTSNAASVWDFFTSFKNLGRNKWIVWANF